MLHAIPDLATSSHDIPTHTNTPQISTGDELLTLSYADLLFVAVEASKARALLG